MQISAIVAKSLNNVIGVNNQLPWRLPADLKYFKEKTLHHHVLMGRKTYQSIGKPLPQRTSIVLTQQFLTSEQDNLFFVNSLQEGIALAKQREEKELFIIGGGELYRLAMPLLDRLYVTEIQAEFRGDTYFPLFNEHWQEINRVKYNADEKHHFAYHFIVYEKR